MDFRLPSSTAIEFLHRKYAPNQDIFVTVFRHGEIVWSIAEQLINSKKLVVDRDLVRVGAMLHDIGYYVLRPNEEPIRHGIRGAKLLKDEGYPVEICRFAACHIGVGLTRDDIVRDALPLPPHNFVARTTEERLVMYADNFHSKFAEQFDSYDAARAKMFKIASEKADQLDALAQEFGRPNLHALSQHFGDKIH